MVRTLWDALGEVPDRRGRKGRQYPLQSVLGIAVAAMLAGANDLIAIFRWGRRLKPEALLLFGIESGRAPCHATYHYFFQSLDADALAQTLGRFAAGEAKGSHIAIEPAPAKAGARRSEAAGVWMPRRCMCSPPSRPNSARLSATSPFPPIRTRSRPPSFCSKACPRWRDHHRRRDLHPARDLPAYARRKRSLSVRRQRQSARTQARYRHRLHAGGVLSARRRPFPPPTDRRQSCARPRRSTKGTAASRRAGLPSAPRWFPISVGRASPRWQS